MKVVLELQDQPSNIKKVTVRHDIVIGRGAECNLRLSSPQVSRRHCFLRIGADGASLSDLDSSNGTTLNGKKLTSGKRYAVPNGAMISVGPVKFIAHVQSEVLASEVQVAVAGSQIQAEPPTDPVGPFGANDVGATIAGVPPEDGDRSSMDFAIEQGGGAATEDEPTADCVVADHALVKNSADELVVEVAAEGDEDETLLGGLPDAEMVPEAAVVEIPEEILQLSDEAIEVIEVEEVLEVEEILDDVEVLDDEVVEIEEVLEDELIDVVEEVDDVEILEIADEDEVLVVDEDDIIEVVDELEIVDDDEGRVTDSAPDSEVGDCVEDELKSFLKGLD